MPVIPPWEGGKVAVRWCSADACVVILKDSLFLDLRGNSLFSAWFLVGTVGGSIHGESSSVS